MTSIDPPLTLKTSLPEHLYTVKLERYVTVANDNVRRRAACPIITNETDPEMACKVYEEFVDICTEHRLHLNTGVLKFEFFRQCLNGQARAHWDTIVAGLAGANDDAAFTQAITQWFSKYFEATAYHDQKQYFLSATKAYSMSVKETATRLECICRYMTYMPGYTAGTEVYSPVEKKMTLYRLMRNNWKTNFDASGNDITSPAYTWDNLIYYFSAQERRDNKSLPGGRSPGRGGRGRGRLAHGTVRRAVGSSGPPSRRFRSNNYGVGGQGWSPAPYGGGYGGSYNNYGYSHYSGGGGRFGGRGAMVARGAGPGPDGGGRFGGRGGGRFVNRGGRGGRGRGGRNWRNPAPPPPPGFTRRGTPGRAGVTYLTDGTEIHNVESSDSADNNGSNESQEQSEEYDARYEEPYNEHYHVFDDPNLGYFDEEPADEMEYYGDY